MGNIVSLIGKAAIRPVKNIAVEVRAEKVISRDKPIPAPWHPTTEKRLQEIKQEFPEGLSQELNEKDEELLKKLKSVYVTSHDPSPPELKKENPLRPLPKVREYQGSPEMGYTEPDMIPKGKISMRQALLMIGKHHQDRESNTALALAQEYTLELQTTDHILKHFRTFEYYEPPNAKKMSITNVLTYKALEPKSSSQAPQLEDSKDNR